MNTPGETVAWLHVQGNHTEPSLYPLSEEELARGWVQHELCVKTPGFALVPATPTTAMLLTIKEVAPRWFAPSVWAALLEAAKVVPEAKPRCPACQYQYGHAIGCEHNPVDLALKKT